MAARNGIAERLTDLSGAPEAHVAALGAALRLDANGAANGTGAGGTVFGGDLSLQNALDQVVASLRGVPPYGTREMLVLQSALATCDPVCCCGVHTRAPSPCYSNASLPPSTIRATSMRP